MRQIRGWRLLLCSVMAGMLCCSCGGEDRGNMASLSFALTGPWYAAIQDWTGETEKCWYSGGSGNAVQLEDCPVPPYFPIRKTYTIFMNGDWYKFMNNWSGACVTYTGTGTDDNYTETSCTNRNTNQDFAMPDFGDPPTKIIPRNASSYWIRTHDSNINNTSQTYWVWEFIFG